MNIIQVLILGIVQGITEFIPISSSAHLIILPYLFRWQLSTDQFIPLEIIMQWGTLVALVVFFHQDLGELWIAFIQSIKSRHPFQNKKSRLAWLIIFSVLPAVIAILLFKDKVEAIFDTPLITVFLLFVTAFLLTIAEVIGKKNLALESFKQKNALIVGIFQVMSIFPGISRAGTCITGGMIQDFNREDAARFSFLIGIPLMLVSGINNLINLIKIQNLSPSFPFLLIGFTTSAIVGYFILRWLLPFLSEHSLFPFAFYCILLGVIVIGNGLFFSNTPIEGNQSGKSQTIDIIYPSSLKWILPIAMKCNANYSAFTLRFSPSSNNSTNADTIVFAYQPEERINTSTYLLGHEHFVVSVNLANPISSLTMDQVREIFMGTNRTWGDFSKSCNQCVNFDNSTAFAEKNLTLWVYPPASAENSVLQNIIMNPNFNSVNAEVAPDPQALLEALQFNPAAIGILPRHWVDKTIKSINVPDAVKNNLLFPILINVPINLADSLKPLLLCMQNSIGG